jgi:anti-sigma factor RsiW
MSQSFQCGDQSALVTYLYDECTPEERDTIAAHLARCVACASEISGLTSTRQILAQWTPPEIDLGLQITSKADEAIAPPPGTVLAFRRPQVESQQQPAPWWKAPLPAWAQVAAALAIFAAGLSVGFVRDGGRAPAPQQAVTTSPAPVPVSTGPTKTDLAELEQRLRAEMTQLVRANSTAQSQQQAVPVAARVDEDAIMQKVQTLLAEQRIDFTERMVRQRGEFDALRRADLQSVGTRVGQIGTELQQHRQTLDGIAFRVGLSQGR